MVWLFSQPNLRGKLARWALEHQQPTYTVRHRPGKIHLVPDALSRLPRIDEDGHDDEQDLMTDEVSDKAAEVAEKSCPPTLTVAHTDLQPWQTRQLLSNLSGTPDFHPSYGQVSAVELVAAAVVSDEVELDTQAPLVRDLALRLVVNVDSLPVDSLSSTTICVITLPTDDELVEIQKSCRGVNPTRRYVEDGKQGQLNFANPLARHAHDLHLRNDLLVRIDPNDSTRVTKVIPFSLRPRVLQYYHEGPSVNHLGYAKVFDRMKSAVWWPGMDTDLRRLCQACPRCRQKTSQVPSHVRPLQPITADYPNQFVAVDLFGPFLPSREGYQYVEVFTDVFSKFIMLRDGEPPRAPPPSPPPKAWWPGLFATVLQPKFSPTTVPTTRLKYFVNFLVCLVSTECTPRLGTTRPTVRASAS